MSDSNKFLQVKSISKRFGGLAALSDVSFSVAEGSTVGLIGPNGAGKTTAFNIISGTLPPSSGQVFLNGQDITNGPPSHIVGLGLARTFQHTSIYPKITVAENIYRGTLRQITTSTLNQLFNGQATRTATSQARSNVQELLELMGLSECANVIASELSYGFQKRLGVAVGLATQPRLLLLDEPAAGLNPEESAEFGRLLLTIKTARNLTLLLVEHHVALVKNICDRVHVLVQGQLIAQGTPNEIFENPAVIEAYLGSVESEYA